VLWRENAVGQIKHVDTPHCPLTAAIAPKRRAKRTRDGEEKTPSDDGARILFERITRVLNESKKTLAALRIEYSKNERENQNALKVSDYGSGTFAFVLYFMHMFRGQVIDMLFINNDLWIMLHNNVTLYKS